MAVTNYIWDPLNDSLLMETDEFGAPSIAYTQEPRRFGGLISQGSGEMTHYFHQDKLGSTCLLTDETGMVTDTFDHDAWGNEIARSGQTDTPFRWLGGSGYYFDIDTASYYVRAREYQPVTSRWLSPDSLGFVDGPNLYLYVGNSPLSNLDPSGNTCNVCLVTAYYRDTTSSLDAMLTTPAFTDLAKSLTSGHLFSAVATDFGIPAYYDHAGPWFNTNAVEIKDGAGNVAKPQAIKVGSYLFFVAISVCETKDFDCRIYLDETGTSLRKVEANGRETVDPANSIDHGDITYAGVDVRRADIKNVHPVAPCKKMIIYGDLPQTVAILQGAPPGKFWGTQTVKQRIRILDSSASNAERATFSHTVTIGVGPRREEIFAP